ncbi:flagellin [Candidatus Phycosocius spiralis]|uniref:Flagellin n=1 Tax=Candidatus Phycosocius spiralis TaxID=2815099 RepID=A0ABQ4PTJ3_9PROT|nr:flagellin [Candidatus Phycosocius spiralis]GIU66337.1 flagellin [Candidatus Phycosocius spiralis]
MISVNTNVASMAAIQNLAATGRDLAASQKAVSTGKKVADVADNGAIWVIANKMGGDLKSYDRVRESATRAGAILDTAVSAAESIMDRLNDMKGKALAAIQPGLSTSSLNALNADFVQLRDQITTSVANATFDGANMIGTTPASAISLGDANGGNTITIAGVNLNLGQSTITVAANATLDTTGTAAGVTANTTILNAINTSIGNLGTEMARLGAGAKRFDAHLQFVSKLQDALTTGIGSMVDADLAGESAKLQSLQVKQQLGLQALSIANAGVQSALALFR